MDNSRRYSQNSNTNSQNRNRNRTFEEDLFNEFNFLNRPRQRSTNDFNMEYNSIIHALRDVLVSYNNNMNTYQDNIQSFLQIMRSIQQDMRNDQNVFEDSFLNTNRNNNQNSLPQPLFTPPSRFQQNSRNQNVSSEPIPILRNRTNTNTNTSINNNTTANTYINSSNTRSRFGNTDIPNPNPNSLLSYILRPSTNINRNTQPTNFFTTTMFQDIEIRPTEQQINTASRLVDYSINTPNINASCPITLEEFQEGDIIRRINYCGHAFREPAIQNWFLRNVRCPICRYDIRDYNPENINVGRGLSEPIRPITIPSPENSPILSPNTNLSPRPNIISNTNQISVESDTDELNEHSPVVNEFLRTMSANIVNVLQSYINESTTDINDVSNNLDLLQSYINGESTTSTDNININQYNDASNNLIYRFEIPIYYNEYYDLSNNLIAVSGMGSNFDDVDNVDNVDAVNDVD